MIDIKTSYYNNVIMSSYMKFQVGFVLLNVYFSVQYFVHYIVCPCAILRQAFVLSALRFTASDYSFGIFKLLLVDRQNYKIPQR